MPSTIDASSDAFVRALFDAPFDLSTGPLRNYDVSPDGQTFVFVRGASEAPWKQFDVALHWTPAPASEGK
jgi:hypothetical protein